MFSATPYAGVFRPSHAQAPARSQAPAQAPAQAQVPTCFVELCGHGEKEEPQHPNRSWTEGENQKFDSSVFGGFNGAPPAHLVVARVMDPSIFGPGLSLSSCMNPSNFTSHVPIMTKEIVNSWPQFMGSQSPDIPKLERLGGEILEKIKEIDIASGIVYHREESSVPELVSPDNFYKTYEVNRDNFFQALHRIIYPRPNVGEGLISQPDDEPTKTRLQPGREVQIGKPGFELYGIFIVASQGGILPESCTLKSAHEDLLDGDFHIDGKTFPKYKNAEVQKYNLVSWENRKDVEANIGINMGFLTFAGNEVVEVAGHEQAWTDYKHDINGPIQALRRAVIHQKFSHVELALILRSFGFINILALDSACNCPSELAGPASSLDSQDLRPPIPPDVLRFSSDDDYDKLKKLREKQRQAAAAGAASAASLAAPPLGSKRPMIPRGGSRKSRKRTTSTRKKITRKTKKRAYKSKSQKRNRRK
jgi:hypothetical protein